MTKAMDVANYFLYRAEKAGAAGPGAAPGMQMLVYCAQGFALAILGRPLFKENFKATDAGPRVASLDRRERCEPLALCRDGWDPKALFDDDECRLLEQIHKRYAAGAGAGAKQQQAFADGYKRCAAVSKAAMARHFTSLADKQSIERQVLDEEALHLLDPKHYRAMLLNSLAESRSGKVTEHRKTETHW